ncbi:BTB/POZ domain-containing protein [Tothia fuscella]|uniref:BTB/POZ domain-containing protein n=1 Tax=Tothia fuscella TaxID=1048955 RepID=A0A9P4NYI4_9PEZI|nr:BTB/POZ domain-containing protein [Tothia fuscella]
MVLRKTEIEAALFAENEAISAGRLKEDNPLDLTDDFSIFCEACRRGDLKVCQEKITAGVNINARDTFDYTPLILASLCGHYEVVRLLLESGVLCERDTFQGERALYNALTDRIRNLLLSYDYSKSTNPLQPLAAHVASLLLRTVPKTSDLALTTGSETFRLHKFVLAARSPYFAKKLTLAPETNTWRLPNTVPSESIHAAIQFLYLSDISRGFGGEDHEHDILAGVGKLSRTLEIDRLFEYITATDKRWMRQQRDEEVNRGRDELAAWFTDNILKYKINVETSKAADVKWDRNNGIFADVLLRADEDSTEDEEEKQGILEEATERLSLAPSSYIPIGPMANKSRSPSKARKSSKSVVFPAHKAMLLRSEFFNTMFCSAFKEAQSSEYLQVIPIDCSPEVLEIVLTFLYTEKTDFPLDIAIEVLFAADLLFIEKLKVKAAQIISTLGNGTTSSMDAQAQAGVEGEQFEEVLDIYDVIRAGWATRVQRLEEFGARYIAYRLENYIDQEEFLELVKESAGRVEARQETDTIELIDDIRYHLSERFRLRFEDAGIEEMMEEAEMDAAIKDSLEPEQVIRTLDGEDVEDEFAQDYHNYRMLSEKIDVLLEQLNLDA